jgi:glycosyltransferase involved in cell wall biosynthesis
LMVEPYDPEAMAKGLFRLMSDTELRTRLGAGAQERATSEHTPEAYRSALVEFYRETIAK